MNSNLNNNMLRKLTCEDFTSEIDFDNLSKVAIVGGSVDDPEANLIRTKFPNVHFSTYGISDEQIYMNLNSDPVNLGDFDLVICANVIEHIFNHENFSRNLLSVLKSTGTLWLVFPFNDLYHGSPEYYSAGFHPEYVNNLFLNKGCEVQKSKIISSKRLYLFTHLLKTRPSEFRYRHPLIGQITWSLGLHGNPRPPIKNLSASHIIFALLLCFTKKDFDSDPNFGCGAWVKITKP